MFVFFSVYIKSGYRVSKWTHVRKLRRMYSNIALNVAWSFFWFFFGDLKSEATYHNVNAIGVGGRYWKAHVNCTANFTPVDSMQNSFWLANANLNAIKKQDLSPDIFKSFSKVHCGANYVGRQPVRRLGYLAEWIWYCNIRNS